MITLLSPAKKMDLAPAKSSLAPTTPGFLEHTRALMQRARELSVKDLRALMGISEKLAELNYQRFQNFDSSASEEGKSAALAFQGDVYQGLQAATLGEEDLAFAQDHVRILSGLYGLLRPLDRILAYRLEMGSRLESTRGKNLYAFWGSLLGEALVCELADHPAKVLVNLASNEYFKAVARKTPGVRVVTPVFQEIKEGVPKVISFVAKRSRGIMTRWIVKQRIDSPEDLKDFTEGGYRLVKGESTEDRLVFRRKFRSAAEKK
jgi:cytoplasmic iron level regulating protein YaaA (DUF328/UPF0246 family)